MRRSFVKWWDLEGQRKVILEADEKVLVSFDRRSIRDPLILREQTIRFPSSCNYRMEKFMRLTWLRAMPGDPMARADLMSVWSSPKGRGGVNLWRGWLSTDGVIARENSQFETWGL